jgi:EAL domain-containing protein (putative c-di-GMP-specific phosphodiesterase class I)/GGDEF domain-containing protein
LRKVDEMLHKLTASDDEGRESPRSDLADRVPVEVFRDRRAFEDGICRILAARANGTYGHVVLYLVADGFAAIKELCGADAGGRLLQRIGKALRPKLRRGVLAHLGNAEFAVLAQDTTARDAENLALTIVRDISSIKLSWKGKSFSVSAYAGGVATGERQDGKALLELAEAASRVAKEKFGSKVHVAREQEEELLRWQDELLGIAKINSALEHDRFVLYAQQIASLAGDGKPTHAELLTRMVGEDGRLIPPTSFVKAAERFGMVEQLDRHILEKVFQILAVRGRQGAGWHGKVGINVSGITLSDERFPEYVKTLLERYEIKVSDLWFEITETAAIANMDNARRFISELHAIGAKVGLDDFGSGASSFQYLADLPVEYLKVDGSLIRSMANSHTHRVMVQSVCSMARALGMKTVAESVEDAATLQLVRAAGFDCAQGWYVHKPEPWTAGGDLRDSESAGPGAGS